MINTVKDVSTLTTIPEKTLTKFYRKMIFSICEGIEESLLDDNIDISSFDIGIGTLYIKHDNVSNVKYHFEPNEVLSKAIAQTLVNKKNLLEDTLTDALASKFMEVYKDLCE